MDTYAYPRTPPVTGALAELTLKTEAGQLGVVSVKGVLVAQDTVVLMVSAVHGAELHTDTGSCTTQVELAAEEIFLKLPKGLIIFPSQSTLSAILVGKCYGSRRFLNTQS